MLQIGFATKYFTLWDVQNETEYSGSEGQYSYNVTRFTYLQNLSLVEENAIAKAKEKGCTELGINDELRGRSGRSFQIRTPKKEVFENYQFTYGKYRGDDIRENTDVNYLKWYFNETELMVVAERVCELDSDYSIYEDRLVNEEQLDNLLATKKIEDKLKKTGTIQLEMERNLDTYGFVQIDGIPYSFENYVQRSYNGYGYGLPTLNGKAKRVKNKIIEVKVEFGYVDGWEMWKVIDWDFVK